MFARLKQNLTSRTEEVIVYVTKFIAHAASPESRAIAGADNVGPTLNHLWGAHEVLCQIASFASIVVLGHSMAPPLPIPQYDQFAYIDRPLVTTDDAALLEEEWRKYDEESREWTLWGLDAFETEWQ